MSSDITFNNGLWTGHFKAMASPCEVLVDSEDGLLANRIWQKVKDEALRIEQKFSRYRQDNIIDQINHSQGLAINVDAETARLLDYADQCYQLSEGMFDISSGVLRKVWRFDGSDMIPAKSAVAAIMDYVGWEKIHWQSPNIIVPANMEIDLGGIGKEYAVDSAISLIKSITTVSCLVNFGGDIAVTGARQNNQAWSVGIESTQYDEKSSQDYWMHQGAIATSGDAKRFLLKNGQRYSHILNPQTGWPVKNTPRSVTVIAGSCTEAGILATLAMLQGEQANSFLQTQQVEYFIQA